MNPAEAAEEIIACRMASINEALDDSLLPETNHYMKHLIRMQIHIAAYEAMNYAINEIEQSDTENTDKVIQFPQGQGKA